MSAKLLKVVVVIFLLLVSFFTFPTRIDAFSSQFVIKGNTSSKLAALTFDDGSDGTNIGKILQILSSHQVKSTFFLTGKGTSNHSEAIKRIAEAGHELATHSYSHVDFTQLTASEIKTELAQTEAVVKSTTGHSTKPLFRAPYGSVNKAVLNTVGSVGYTKTIHWTIDTLDWKGLSKTDVTNRVMNNIVPGAIILMHTGVGASGTPSALPDIIRGLQSKGYQFVTVSEILNPPTTSRTHRVKSGETLYRIALNYNVTVDELVRTNGLSDASYIRAGQALIIPGKASLSNTYMVKPGDTLYSISLRYETTVDQLALVNELNNPGLIRAGQILIIPSSSKITYTVQAGDTLYSIARKYGATVQTLADANQISNPGRIFPGDKLVIPT
ncbi:LysM peptidoglycan-binding domain-containing protein [Halobacillus mangrovi]|uniref:Polysaccharide deacetylase n=1 Tax=Halobacillus mangrovi TaxID=402384 RepID=A0A1W5ZZE1_9BACI|nr:LysM peptidoglycan-binding domain-containing protein [Halobacillus mangrovi]ARI78611.1 polysaccharide deacetylase [Halobacillus mangrovi]